MRSTLATIFSPSLLIFYGLSLSGVIALFNVVTRYGSTQLEAPPDIGGDYQIRLPADLTCPKPATGTTQPLELRLTLQQSGLYLSASLTPIDPQTNASHPLTLAGRWTKTGLHLAGPGSNLQTCFDRPQILLQGNLINNQLQGNLQLSTVSQTIEFTAPRTLSRQNSESH